MNQSIDLQVKGIYFFIYRSNWRASFHKEIHHLKRVKKNTTGQTEIVLQSMRRILRPTCIYQERETKKNKNKTFHFNKQLRSEDPKRNVVPG